MGRGGLLRTHILDLYEKVIVDSWPHSIKRAWRSNRKSLWFGGVGMGVRALLCAGAGCRMER